VLSGRTHRIAIALVPLEIAHLAMVQWAIDGVAASGQIASRERFCKRGNSRQKQRHKGGDGGEFADDFSQFERAPNTRLTRAA
jgi:hypothetical protein